MMKRHFITILLLSAIGLTAYGAEFPVSKIPDKLSNGAKAVVRQDDVLLTIDEDGSAIENGTYAITIMNENGKELGYFYAPYNKFIRIKKIKGELYDKNGDKVRKFKKSEIYDISNIQSYSLYEDSRLKMVIPEYNDYPYTVVYEYEKEFRSILRYPSSMIIPDYNVSTESSSYKVVIPQGKELRYYTVGVDAEPDIVQQEGNQVYSWSFSNVPLIRDEPATRNAAEYFPSIHPVPVEVNYGGVYGSFRTWKDVGEWIWGMVEDKRDFSPETKTEIKQVINDCGNDREIVEKLYRYMQDKVRYVNISIGLGGFEPIEAQRVHDVSYGDCKALTNYMASMLDLAGINSVYTLVRAGSSPAAIETEYPSQQFNHVILMVPLEEDSIWLECTSQRLPPGYLGTFTDDRTVLYITEDGGELGRSPSFRIEENYTSSNTHITIDEQLNAVIKRDRRFAGNYFNSKYSTILNQDDTEQKRSIQSSLGLSGFNLVDFNYTPSLEPPVYVDEHIEVVDDRFLTTSGDYIMMPLNTLVTSIGLRTRVRNRKQEIFIRRDRMYMDTVRFTLPGNVEVAEMPAPVTLESDFGTYSSKVIREGEDLLFVREIRIFSGCHPPGRYQEYYDYYKELVRTDGQQVMLKFVG